MSQSQSHIKLPQFEEEIFKYWNDNQIFKYTLDQTKDRDIFNFYDGPPFATGSPHYGHLLAATIKDTICRYQTINGKYVPRINGFDCHGLPIEQLGEKTLGIKTTDEINKMGIDKFNQACSSLVLSCAKDWESLIPRMGRWVDFENGYKTMDFEFMNATWGVFKSIFDKGLVYRSLTPMPYSTGCGSCLSHFEAKSNYQDTQDPSVVVKFNTLEINDNINIISYNNKNYKISFLVWTTTPYSLTANQALCINKNIKYCLVKTKTKESEKEVEEAFIIAKESIKTWEQKNNKFEIIQELDSESLIGVKYIPPYSYFMSEESEKIFTVLEDSYVKVDSGTGIVHLAPSMGEDDFRVCLREGIINLKKPETIYCPIDEKGCLTVHQYNGQYVKVADKNIIKDLKTNNLLWEAKTIMHSYPFCYRTDTPLIQKSISAWFIDVHSINDKILELNKGINWIPNSVGESRFAQWLSTPRDWSFGRNRYWGTPVPLWVNDDFTEIICIGSTLELEELAGLPAGSIKDMHREFVDNIMIPSNKNPGTFLTKISDVFDCWFESGSMPYGKFAVENKLKGSEIYDLLSNKNIELRKEFLKYFPADFIGEGLDQTRGWFYTLLVISTILFEDTAYKNVIVNGLILSADPTSNGKWIKMSKRYKNYPNPEEVLVKYGADSLRLYLLDSPVTHSEPLKFQEDGLQQKSKFLIQLFNCFQFLDSEIKLFLQNKKLNVGEFCLTESTQIYDKWILGKLKEVCDKANKSYSEYKLYLVVPLLIEFEELFSKWYLNLAKNNMKGFNGESIQVQSLSTLWKLLLNFAIIISPITPFMSEKLYSELSKLVSNHTFNKTIHLELLSECVNSLTYDPLITRKVGAMVSVVMSVRGLKSGSGIGVRMKSKELILKHSSQEFLDDIKELESELLTAIRINKITYQLLDLNNQYDLMVKISTNHTIGKTCKRDLMAVLDVIKNKSPFELIGKESINVMGYDIPGDTWVIIPQTEKYSNDYLIDYTSQGLLIQLTKDIITTPLEDQMELMIKNIQKAKKNANLKPFEIVDIYIYINEKENDNNNDFYELIKEEFENITERIRSNMYLNDVNANKRIDEFTQELHKFNGEYYSFTIYI